MFYLLPEDYMTTVKSLFPSHVLIYLILVNMFIMHINMCVSVYLVCMYVCALDAGLVWPRLEQGAGTAGIGIIDGFKLP